MNPCPSVYTAPRLPRFAALAVTTVEGHLFGVSSEATYQRDDARAWHLADQQGDRLMVDAIGLANLIASNAHDAAVVRPAAEMLATVLSRAADLDDTEDAAVRAMNRRTTTIHRHSVTATAVCEALVRTGGER